MKRLVLFAALMLSASVCASDVAVAPPAPRTLTQSDIGLITEGVVNAKAKVLDNPRSELGLFAYIATQNCEQAKDLLANKHLSQHFRFTAPDEVITASKEVLKIVLEQSKKCSNHRLAALVICAKVLHRHSKNSAPELPKQLLPAFKRCQEHLLEKFEPCVEDLVKDVPTLTVPATKIDPKPSKTSSDKKLSNFVTWDGQKGDPRNTLQAIGMTVGGLTIADAATQTGLDLAQIYGLASGKYHKGLNNQVFNVIYPLFQCALRIATPIMLMAGKETSAGVKTVLAIAILLSLLDAGWHIGTIPQTSLTYDGVTNFNNGVRAHPKDATSFAWQQTACALARNLARGARGTLETHCWRKGNDAFIENDVGTKKLYVMAFISWAESLLGTFGVRFMQQKFIQKQSKAAACYRAMTEPADKK